MKLSEHCRNITRQENELTSVRHLAYDFLECESIVEKCLVGMAVTESTWRIYRQTRIGLDEGKVKALLSYFNEVTGEDAQLHAHSFTEPFHDLLHGPKQGWDGGLISEFLKCGALYTSIGLSVIESSKVYRDVFQEIAFYPPFTPPSWPQWAEVKIQLRTELSPSEHVISGSFDEFYEKLRFSPDWMRKHEKWHSAWC